MKLFSYLLIAVLSVTIVSSIGVNGDTTIVQDEITYTIMEESGVKEVETFYQGIKVDGDSLMTTIEGGLVNITFYEWGEEKRIGLYTSTPQTLRFKWLVNDSKQYFKDDIGLHIDTYRVSEGHTNITLIEKADSEERIDITDNRDSGSWFRNNVFFFVLNGYLITITNGILLSAGAFVLGVILLFRVIRS